MPELFSKPVWAGVVIQMDDGRTYAFQLDNSMAELLADINVEFGSRETARSGELGWLEMEPDGTFKADIRVVGRGRNWKRGKDQAPARLISRLKAIAPRGE